MALPWYILCAMRNPDFLRVFIFQHNFERYLTPLFQHRQPFWFFIPITLLAILPWTALLWPVTREALRLWREKSLQRFPRILFRLLGDLSSFVFQPLAIETAKLHSSRGSAARVASRNPAI